jgi:hypothetical protein
MGEVFVFSLLMGSLGLQAIFVGAWLRWQQVVKRECEEEEEAMTPYDSPDALQAIASHQTPRSGKAPKDPRLVGWEFKIVRSQRDVFRDPLILQRVCEEEANSGWILLEKLDDRRVRFKRPIALREIIKADMMPVDPYRSQYGASTSWNSWLLGITGLILILLPAYLAFALVSMTLTKPAVDPAATPSTLPAPTLNPPSVPNS